MVLAPAVPITPIQFLLRYRKKRSHPPSTMKAKITFQTEDPSYLHRKLSNARCIAVGCLQPWNAVENRFILPGYESPNNQATTVRGPPPLCAANLPRSVKHLIDTAATLDELPPEYVLSQPPDEPVAKTSAVPVIDLTGLDGQPEVRKPIVDAICSACADWGVFMIINHGIELSLMEETIRVSEEFHNLPLEEKMQYASDDVMNPIRYGSSLNTPKKHEFHWRDFLRHCGDGYADFWPSNPPNYRAVVKKYLDESRKLCFRLFGALSEGLGLEQDFIEKSLNGGMQIIVSNYYPPCPEPARALGLAAHTDHGPLTILLQNGIDGLQVKHDGEWVIVNQIPGSLIVNVGDYTEILSNGRYKSVEHRASVNADRTRISIPCVVLPALTTVVEPASPLVNEKNKIKYRPVLYEQYVRFVQEKVNRAGKSALEAIRVDETAEDVSACADAEEVINQLLDSRVEYREV